MSQKKMTKSVFDHNDFVLLESKKGNLFCQYVMDIGFCKGVNTSENYHFHSSYEIHIPVSGELHILVEDKDIYLHQGMACIIPPNSVHYVFGNPDSFRINFRFQFSCLKNSTDTYYDLYVQTYGSIKDVCVVDNCRVYQKYLSVAVENLMQNLPDFMVTDLLFLTSYDIAAAIDRSLGEDSQNPEDAFSCCDRFSYPLLAEKIEVFFNQHYEQTVSVTDLAAHLNFSKRHTERILRKLFGMSFSEMLHKKRLETAKLLLRVTDMPVTEIAEKLGYQDENYFYRKFSAAYQITPGQYRSLVR